MALTEPTSRGGEPEGSPPRGVHALDLLHGGRPGVITSWLLDGPEPTLIDPGPDSTWPNLVAGLAEHGLAPRDVRHVLATHVHLDHAGVAGRLARANPDLAVHVHPDGLPHLADPERLIASTRRTFGDAHDRLWGEMDPVPRDQLRTLEEGQAPFPGGPRALATPGHIGHHLGFLLEDPLVYFAGDSLGIVLGPGAPTHPATPPPGVNVGAWLATLERIRRLGVRWVALAHSGLHSDAVGRADQMEGCLRDLVSRIRGAGPEGHASARRLFAAETRATFSRYLTPEWVDAYFGTFEAQSDWDGVAHFLARNPDFELPAPGG